MQRKAAEKLKGQGWMLKGRPGRDPLEQSSQVLQSIFRSVPVGIGMVRSGEMTEANDLLCEMTGYTRDEMVGQSARMLYPSQAEFERVGNEKYRQIEKTGTGSVETVWKRKDGSLMDVLLCSSALDPANLDDGLTFTTLDITEQKRIGQEMTEHSDLLSAIYHNAPLIMMVVNAERRIHHVNGFVTQLANRDAEEMLGLRNGEALHCLHALDDPQGCGFGGFCRHCVIRNTVLDTLKTGKSHSQIEAPLSFKEAGNEAQAYQFFLSTTPIRIRGERMVLVTLQDITETKRLEEKLRRDHDRINFILAATRTHMNTLDSEYNLLSVDFVWQVVYGDPRGRKCHEYFMGLDEPCTGCGVPKALATREITVTEQFLPKENRYVEVHTIPVQNEKGEWIVNEFKVDITDRKREETEKAKLQSQLNQAQKMDAVGRLAGGIAHDFNNMLGVILGHIEMAMEEADPAQLLFENLQQARQAAERSVNLTRQLLTFARKQTITPKIVDLNKTVDGMLKMLRRLIGEDIDLTWRPGANLAPVKVDPSQIDQIIANLCVNARDAIDWSPAGMPLQRANATGKITIETDAVSFDEDDCAVCAEFDPGDYVLLAVSDNGCGMDPETVARLFEPFFTTKELGKGTGLGLASVYGAVRQNKGFINVYSEVGQGTTFKIYLPQHAEREPRRPEKETAKLTVGGNETILLVEDEPAILRLTTMMLESLGYDVIAASAPGEALRLADEHSGCIDLLITDVVMPEMNGRDLAKKLLTLYPGMKRLFMSGYTAEVIVRNGVLDNGVDFIHKPFSSKDLAPKLREVLKGKSAD